MHRFHALLVVFVLVLCLPATADTLTTAGSGKVVEIVDGDTLILQDGREVRLVGIQAPKLPLGRRNFKTWPLADEAKSALLALSLYKTVTLSYGGRRVDRYDRQLAHLHDETGSWIQGEILRRGMARVYSFRDNRAQVAEMLAIEREARQAKRGIWRHAFYQVRHADNAQRHIGSFQLVEGTVRAVAVRRKYTYLNFGANWRDDFTIAIPAKAHRMFKESGLDPESLQGRNVRVRGWIKSRNGPMIDASHPEQIEILP
ncbi:MAG: thermonuclease family protein [Rhodospirillaceae bacterium]|nr:thermonuclease family protein [Rhodospirillaceae bacterium]MDD9918207.1 thermonuclease family protein [Rhodospirillaceae bacterium]MDD9925349.1 thermonuclease family protein [Rhodospirillaceae bacterium]